MFKTEVEENILNTHFTFSNSFFFFFEKRAVYEIMWANIVEPDRPRNDNTAHAYCMLDT